MVDLQPYLDRLPLIAILRGVTPHDVLPIAEALVGAGFSIIEVPLNSPDAIESIRLIAKVYGDRVLTGAGTVTRIEEINDVAGAGGRIIVMPHGDVAVIRAAKAAGLMCTPGIATPTEGFAALGAGADALKLFPAELLPPTVLKAMLSVFPKRTRVLPVGGITPHSIASYRAAGAAGFGLGSALYKPGMSVAEVEANARAFAKGWRESDQATSSSLGGQD